MSVKGGLKEIDADGLPAIEAIIVESLADLAVQENSPTFKLDKILTAHKQVTGGMSYHITADIVHDNQKKVCKLHIFERLWLGERQVTIECDEKSYKVERKDIK